MKSRTPSRSRLSAGIDGAANKWIPDAAGDVVTISGLDWKRLQKFKYLRECEAAKETMVKKALR